MYIIVAGIGVVGGQVTQTLVRDKHDVVAIDIDKKTCEELYEVSGVTAIVGSATDINTLNNAGIKKADVFLCLMRSDSANIASALIAKSFGVKKIIVCLRKPGYEKAYQLAGVDSIIKLPELLLNKLISEVEEPEIKKITSLKNDGTNVYAIKVSNKSKILNKKIKDIVSENLIPEECIFLGILNPDSDKIRIPRGNSLIEPTETVFIIAKEKDLKIIKKNIV